MAFNVFKDRAEKKYLEKQIKKHNNNVAETAEMLGLQKSNLYRKMKELGLTSKDMVV